MKIRHLFLWGALGLTVVAVGRVNLLNEGGDSPILQAIASGSRFILVSEGAVGLTNDPMLAVIYAACMLFGYLCCFIANDLDNIF